MRVHRKNAPDTPTVASKGAMAMGPNSREPCMVAWLSAMPFSSSLRGTRFGTSDWDAGIWAARAEPLISDMPTMTQGLISPTST